MKKLLSILTVLLLSVAGFSQAPGIFNYQGVARNSVGNALINQNITLRLTVHDGSAAGPVVYQESRAVTTNPFGLFNVQVGSAGATNVTGTVAGVNWGVGAKYIQVEIDPNGGTTFINIGTAQMASVPYSLFSATAGDIVLPFNKTQADAGSLFKITNSGTGAGSTALEGLTNSTAGNASAVIGTVTSTGPGGFSAGVRGINNGTGGNGIGVYGSQNGGGWGVYGTAISGIGVNGASTSGIGVNGASTSGTGGRFTTTSGVALHSTGALRLAGINEGANRILAGDASGNATWQDPSVVGIVTGSGTVNRVPRWTPSGTNLGDSRIEDRGAATPPIGINVPAAYTYISVEPGIEMTTSTALAQSMIMLRDQSDGGDVRGFISGRTSPTVAVSAFQLGTLSNHPITFFANNAVMGRWSTAGNLGIGTAPGVDPTTRLQIDNPNTTGSVLVNQTNAANVARGVSVLNANTTGNAYGIASIFAQRGTPGATNFLLTGGTSQTAITGVAGGANGIGVQGSGNTFGVIGVTNTGVGVWGVAVDPTGYGLQTQGRVQIAGQGAAANRVLTSDATGNATWQPLGASGGVSGTGTLNFVTKWTPDGSTIGNSVMFDNGTNVGISTTTPSHKLTVEHTGSTGALITSTSGFSVLDINAATGDAAIRFGNAGINQWNVRNRPGDDYFEIFELGGGGSRMVIQDGTGNVGIGATASPSYRLDVEHGGSTGIRSRSTSSFSVIDIDGASGDAALRFANAGVNQWNVRNRPADDYFEIFELGGGGSRVVIQDGTGNVGIGATVSPSYKLDVEHGGSTGIRSRSTSSFSVIDIDAASGDAALRFANAGVNQWNVRNRPADDYFEIFELGGGGSRVVIQDGTGNVGIGATVSPSYKLDVEHGGSTGIRSRSTSSFSIIDIDAASGDAALRFANAGVNQWNIRNNPATDDLQFFELGGGGERMRIENGTGAVVVTGDFTALGAKLFTMDHPLDPANKVLRHAAAESNEVINFYSGNVTTDASGKATVKLPDYFDAINKDPRYQLTVIGSFAQAIISKEVAGNQFEIATSQPNVKVSWEVKGVRNDARMKNHPFLAVQEKSAAQKGKYLDPESYKQPESRNVSYTGTGASSLDEAKVAEKKVAPPTTGGSLDQGAIVPPVMNKVIDNTGSVADMPKSKPVEQKAAGKEPSSTDNIAPKKPVDTKAADAKPKVVEQKSADGKTVLPAGTKLESAPAAEPKKEEAKPAPAGASDTKPKAE